MKYGSPTIHGTPVSSARQPRRVERPTDERCTGCGRLSYVSGTGIRVNPLTEGQCPDCRDGWACVGCGSQHPLDELSEESLCTRCWVAAMAKEAA